MFLTSVSPHLRYNGTKTFVVTVSSARKVSDMKHKVGTFHYLSMCFVIRFCEGGGWDPFDQILISGT